VAVNGSYAYVADDTSGLRIIDITNPNAPVEAGFFNTPGAAHGVTVSGNFAYVADDTSGLRILDVSNPAAPTETGFCDTPGRAWSVALHWNYAYVADYSSGLRVIDISDPAAPYETGYYDTPGLARGVTAMGSLALVADEVYIGIYDCSGAMFVQPKPVVVANQLTLFPAFPNPFNASTEIRFNLPRASLVQLRVCDMQGRFVDDLASQVFQAGTHRLVFDASIHASGMYVVRMNSGEFSAAKKLVVVK
jgi:hypothetical protein